MTDTDWAKEYREHRDRAIAHPEMPWIMVYMDGRIYSAKVKRFLKQFSDRDGYLKVSISRKGRGRSFSVHALVLTAYVGARQHGMECAHLDGNKTNNNISNLMWVTPRENSRHKYLHGTIHWGEKNHNAKLTEADVRRIREEYCRTGPYHSNVGKLAKKYGVSGGLILKVATRQQWMHIMDENEASAAFAKYEGGGE